MEQLLADGDQTRNQDCPIQLNELAAYFSEHHSEQSVDPTYQAAREFLKPLAAAPEGAYRIDPHFSVEDVRPQRERAALGLQ